MSDLFRNIVFVLVAGGCLIVTGLNHYVVLENSIIVRKILTDLTVQQTNANQIEAAQTYGMYMGEISLYEFIRSNSLEQQLVEANELITRLRQKLDRMELQAEMWDFSLEAQGSYIQQLIAFIESKGLEAPAPIATAEPTPATNYHESLLDEDGHPSP